MARTFMGSPWQIFWKIRMPNALPHIFGGMKISITLAIIGVIVSEFVASQQGIGYLIKLAGGLLDTPLMMASIAVLSIGRPRAVRPDRAGRAALGVLAIVERYQRERRRLTPPRGLRQRGVSSGNSKETTGHDRSNEHEGAARGNHRAVRPFCRRNPQGPGAAHRRPGRPTGGRSRHDQRRQSRRETVGDEHDQSQPAGLPARRLRTLFRRSARHDDHHRRHLRRARHAGRRLLDFHQREALRRKGHQELPRQSRRRAEAMGHRLEGRPVQHERVHELPDRQRRQLVDPGARAARPATTSTSAPKWT